MAIIVTSALAALAGYLFIGGYKQHCHRRAWNSRLANMAALG